MLHAYVHVGLNRRIECIQIKMFITLNCLCVNRPYSYYCWIDSIIGFIWISHNVFEAWRLDTVSTCGQCFSTWANRLCDCLKLLPHERQWCSFSPVCTLLCFTRFPDSVKPIPQCEHFKGFSPVWILLYRSKYLALMKEFPHSEQTWDFTPLCIFWCCLK